MMTSYFEQQLAAISKPDRYIGCASLAAVRSDAAAVAFKHATDASTPGAILEAAAAMRVISYIDKEYARRDQLLTRHARALRLLEEICSWPGRVRAWLGLPDKKGRGAR